MSAVLYLYGFVPKGTAAPGSDVTGLDGSPVRVLELGPFAAAISVMDSGEYGPGQLETRLKDLAWVAARGARHETVVTWFADRASILPARLLTVFSSEDALRAEGGRRSTAISEGLDRFRDLREWDLKVSYDLDVLTGQLGKLSERAAVLDAQIEAAPPGKRYLLERKRADTAKGEAAGVARGLARDLLGSLRHLAEEVSELENPPVRDDLPVVLNAALLVRKDRAGELEAAAAAAQAELRGVGVSASLTGPWAPYRFAGEKSTESTDAPSTGQNARG